MYIKKLINNKGKDTTECQKVIGTDINDLQKLGVFWRDNADKFHLIAVNEFIEWTSGREFSSQEKIAFEQGLASIPLFFEKCYNEMNKLSSAE